MHKYVYLMRPTFRRVSEIATTSQVGQTAIATRFENATIGAEQIAVVTPATVRM